MAVGSSPLPACALVSVESQCAPCDHVVPFALVKVARLNFDGVRPVASSRSLMPAASHVPSPYPTEVSVRKLLSFGSSLEMSTSLQCDASVLVYATRDA